jgi:hypothetical protein
MNSIRWGSSFRRANGSRSDVRQWRRIRRSLIRIGLRSPGHTCPASQLRRRMFKGELCVSRLLYLDQERYSPFGAAKWERSTCVLERDWVYVLAIAIRSALHNPTTKLCFLVGILKVNHGE